MIDQLTERKIKEAADIVDVLGDFYTLQKRGVNYYCLCPFHEDRHIGSFVINPRTNTCHCFSCGQGGDAIAFLMRHERLTYPDALRWLARKYSIDIPADEGKASEAFKHLPRPSKPHAPQPMLPLLELPLSYVKARMDTRRDTLCQWLRSLPWNDSERARIDTVLKDYAVGHTRQGSTIFWQIDYDGKVRTGHVMRYQPDGHRDKRRGASTWIHYLLRRAGMAADEDHADVGYTLFGMHLASLCPGATVNIVESEKTALVAAICWGNMRRQLWMACGGKSLLTAERLKPLTSRGRKIVLYPDRDGADEWRRKAQELQYPRLAVNTSWLDSYWREADGHKADIGDVIVRTLIAADRAGKTETVSEAARRALADIVNRNPAFRLLADRLQLVPVEVTTGRPA